MNFTTKLTQWVSAISPCSLKKSTTFATMTKDNFLWIWTCTKAIINTIAMESVSRWTRWKREYNVIRILIAPILILKSVIMKINPKWILFSQYLLYLQTKKKENQSGPNWSILKKYPQKFFSLTKSVKEFTFQHGKRSNLFSLSFIKLFNLSALTSKWSAPLQQVSGPTTVTLISLWWRNTKTMLTLNVFCKKCSIR